MDIAVVAILILMLAGDRGFAPHTMGKNIVKDKAVDI
jgi:hypothetical protein